MVLLILLVVTIVVAVGLGLLAKMPPRQIGGMCALMLGAALAFYGLVELL